MLRALGALLGPREVRRMMDKMDSDHDGFVDLAEFIAFHCSNGEEEGREDTTEAKLQEAFCIYNADRNGLNSAWELRRVLRQLGRAAGCAHRMRWPTGRACPCRRPRLRRLRSRASAKAHSAALDDSISSKWKPRFNIYILPPPIINLLEVLLSGI